jgi:hypothetical protein
MRPVTFSTSSLRLFLRRNRIATLPQLKQVLGTEADVTVFRKLKELSYHTSYSHRGRFYTLDEIADFDERGLLQLVRQGKFISTTTTPTALKVTAHLDTTDNQAARNMK